MYPFHQALSFINQREAQAAAAQEDDPLALRGPGWGAAHQVGLYAAWRALAPADYELLGGHSARRSGAKWFAARLAAGVHPGVGRRAGSTVLEYVEETLHELPVDLDGSQRRITADDCLFETVHVAPLADRIDAVAMQLED